MGRNSFFQAQVPASFLTKNNILIYYTHFFIVSAEHHLWNRFYCAVVSGNAKVISEMISPEKTGTNTDSDTIENAVLDKWQPDNQEFADKCAENVIEAASFGDNEENEGDSDAVDVFEVLNARWGETGSTLLHVASRTSQTEIIYSLLHHGADPCVR